MKRMKKLLAMMFFCLLMIAVPMTASAAGLNKTSVVVSVSKSEKLKVSGNARKVKWKSSNKKVATVSAKGVVTGKKPGTAQITATAGKNSYTCYVIVRENKFTDMHEIIHYSGNLSFFTDQLYYKSGKLVVVGYLCNASYFDRYVTRMQIKLYDRTGGKNKLLAYGKNVKINQWASARNMMKIQFTIPKNQLKQKNYDLGAIRSLHNQTMISY